MNTKLDNKSHLEQFLFSVLARSMHSKPNEEDWVSLNEIFHVGQSLSKYCYKWTSLHSEEVISHIKLD